ncbi:MAG: hypothetical protein QME81_06975 [bacterium]|nr:hypothetical protein [bacterium]
MTKGRFGDWKKCRDIMRGYDRRIAKKCTVALMRAGLKLESIIKDRIIQSKGMSPLHPFTIVMQGSSKPLIDRKEEVKNGQRIFGAWSFR